MSRGLRVSLGVLAIVVVAVSILAARGQLTWRPSALTADAEDWTPPRTPWGDPDLQGIYNYGTSTPLQRPQQVGDKQVLSDEEAESLQADIARRLDRDRRDGGAQADVSRSYNDVWMDPARMRLTADKRTSLVIDPPDGRLPPRLERQLTPEEQTARAAAEMSTRRFNTGFQESYLDMDVGNRCIIRRRNEGGGHPYLPAIYNNMAQILQAPGYVVIYAEMIHFARIIPVDGRPPLPENVETWLGDPRGRWEGNTLVVETTNLNGYIWMDDSGDFYTDTARLTERMTMIDPDVIHYQVTIEDPTAYTRPWKVAWALVRETEAGFELIEESCREGDRSVPNLLKLGRKLYFGATWKNR